MPRSALLRRAPLLAGLLAGAVALGAPSGASASCAGASLRDGFGPFAVSTTCITASATPSTTAPGDPVDLALSASAPITRYDVDWGDGSPVQPVTYQSGTAHVTHAFPRGRHIVQVQGVEAATTVDSATTTVTATGQPTASLSLSPGLVKPLHDVAFDASGSAADPGGTIAAYEWDFDGNGSYDQVTTAPTTTHAYPAGTDATLHPRVRVTNDLGASATAGGSAAGPDVVVRNAPPSASFSADTDTPAPGQRVSFDASTSRDPDADAGGGILEYRWDLDGNGSYERSTGRSPTVQQAYPNAGRIAVGLQIRDDAGALAVASRRITITDGPGSGSGSGASGGAGSGTAPGPGSSSSGPAGSSFVASLTGPPIQRLARALRRGVALLARANRRASGKLVVALSARDARRLRLSRKRGSRPVPVGALTVRLAPGRTARPTVRLTRRAARALRSASAKKMRLVASGVVKDAAGHQVRLSRVVLLRR